MFFSVLIPVYNEEKYLQSCVDSVIGQSFKDFEIILVDDGSKDKSPKICDDIKSNYSFVKVIHKQNEGPFMARKDGIEAAIGEYLLFLDSDDLLRTDALQILYSTIKANENDLVLFNASTNNNFENKFLNLPFKNLQQFSGSSKSELFRVLCSSHSLNNLCFKCVQRKLFDINNYAVDVKLNYGEDLFQCLPVLDRASKIIYLDENLYFYRQRANSLTHLYSKNQLDSIEYVFSQLKTYTEKWTGNFELEYVDLVNKYAGQECYSLAKNISSANTNFKNKRKSFKDLFHSDFYLKYKKYAYGEVNFTRRVLLKFINTRFIPFLWLIHIAFKIV